MSDVAEVKEALEYWREGILEGQSDNLTAHMLEDAKHFDALADAARRWVRVVEGLDYEAAAKKMWNNNFGEPWDGELFAIAKDMTRKEAKAIVVAAVGVEKDSL